MSELPAGTAGAATVLIIGTCGVAGYAVAGADRVAGQPSRPSLPSPEDLYLGFVGEPPLRGAPQSWRGLGACGDDPEWHQPLRPARSVSATASRGACAGSTTMVRVPASLTAPPRAAGIGI